MATTVVVSTGRCGRPHRIEDSVPGPAVHLTRPGTATGPLGEAVTGETLPAGHWFPKGPPIQTVRLVQ